MTSKTKIDKAPYTGDKLYLFFFSLQKGYDVIFNLRNMPCKQDITKQVLPNGDIITLLMIKRKKESER